MRIKELRDKLANSKLFGVMDNGPVDQSRDVIVQVFRGFNEDDWPIYEYHEVRAVGTLFHGGEFKVVIAVGDE